MDFKKALLQACDDPASCTGGRFPGAGVHGGSSFGGGSSPSVRYETYVVESNTIVITYSGSEQQEVWKIQKLTATELNLAFDYPGENYTDRACYKRIS